jgi:hypothetical protein
MIGLRKKEAATCSLDGAVAASIKLVGNYYLGTIQFTEPMNLLKYYFYNAILPICSLISLGFTYKAIICHFQDVSEDASFICTFKWKDGLILICCYSVVKVVSKILDFKTISRRLLITFGLYCVAYGILAWPFLMASFFQPFPVNVFVHALLIIIAIETLYSKYGFYRQPIRAKRADAALK